MLGRYIKPTEISRGNETKKKKTAKEVTLVVFLLKFFQIREYIRFIRTYNILISVNGKSRVLKSTVNAKTCFRTAIYGKEK